MSALKIYFQKLAIRVARHGLPGVGLIYGSLSSTFVPTQGSGLESCITGGFFLIFKLEAY